MHECVLIGWYIYMEENASSASYEKNETFQNKNVHDIRSNYFELKKNKSKRRLVEEITREIEYY